ncbi:hypothetical protein GCM10020229_42830 [Kitasatospora albolonga]|uniref:hypothetical protein n=1 Tax=Kitasatospora albolonga TaxID=68173 RepID=UPI0031E80F7B
MDKTPSQKHADTVWGAAVLPVLAGWITFHLLPDDNAPGWILYAVGAAATALAHGWFALRRRPPGVGGVVVPVLYVLLGSLFWLTQT